jgi:hypothetical protein
MNNDGWSDNQNEMVPDGLSDVMIAQMVSVNDV